MGYFLKLTYIMSISIGDMGHGEERDKQQEHLLNLTCDIGVPHQGPFYVSRPNALTMMTL